MPGVSTLKDFKNLVQANFEGNEESLHAFGKTYRTQLKSYLIESTNLRSPEQAPLTTGSIWAPLDVPGWFVAQGGVAPNSLFLDVTSGRIWKLHSLLRAPESDFVAGAWIENTRGMDYCWLSRDVLLQRDKSGSWVQRGVGLRFDDGLTPEEESSAFSLKAWHGSHDYLEELRPILDLAKERFAVHSVRWQKRGAGSVVISVEWYSNGKVTVNRGVDVDEVLAHVGSVALQYADSLAEATVLRDDKLGAFELDFHQKIDVDAFAKTVGSGQGEMKLWLVETGPGDGLKRFKGVDLHTWDRIVLDVAEDHAFLSVPRDGCVNAVPRLAVIQAEDNAGRTEVFYDGARVFS